ncbi:filamentous hemagglutinin-like protein [Tolypothrix tenuis PCC 7101]|uniref:Filamentous hemagglutinin-like protein n=1 Tax=Tolypothrix tenuis PCC 7101 TaxID=231146 RepID=A0A1Z4N131_9CYAN|nr:S-layer family protein [Aulosira sp. FACHB-113]BAY99427.1 filamentous hemagglutinin-like protein [Tolypothrix tenuis PCC 7101]BAZ76652.1 filamentous hemagglutinin-like protein [Aulosira laxa NIES-50]
MQLGWLKNILNSGIVVGATLLWSSATNAQVIPDNTLNTKVSESNNNFIIINGTQRGNNLFHSFSQFSIPTGNSALFDNASDVQNIFARVTGGSLSDINGIIRANGSANLFLLNPAGILFGPNAQLQIGGSFIGTTANSIVFADGSKFSATDTSSSPILTISVPVGLQLGSNPGSITVQGLGNNAQLSESLRVSGLNLGTSGLQLQSGKTLALVGGNIAVNGGLLSAPGGNIALGSINNASLVLNSTPQGFTLTYPNGASFGNIELSQRALASTHDVTRGGGGAIQIQGKQVSIQDGSLILVQNRSNQAAGDITINATDSLNIIGKSADFKSSSSLVNETISSGAGGNVIVTTPRLNIDRGGYILTRSFSAGSAGNIVVNADDMRVNGFAFGDPSAFRAVSQVSAVSFGNGKGGNIAISTRNLSVAAGANIAARPYGVGKGGDVNVKADTIQVIGAGAPTGVYFTLISAATFGPGDAGNLTIDTRKLSVEGGGRVSASSIILGNAGSLTINASESVDVSGVKDAENPSYIGTAVLPVGVFSTISRANAGNTTINAPIFKISNGAKVFVENLGSGTAGTLHINANILKLDNQAKISASTKAGEGGNIDLQLRDLLLMRHGSLMSAEAGGSGNGGNITINAPIVVGLENSDIVANAVQGRGGNIEITTQSIFGLKYRDQLTQENDITASSQFGLSGIVQVNTVGVDPNSGLIELPVNITDPSQQIATGCAANTASSFVATGRGGLPQNPMQEVMSDRTWSDIRDISAYRKIGERITHTPKSPTVLIAATSWHRNAQGKIELVAHQSPTQVQPSLTCAALPHI